jgi:NAD(P)-dependent dehydrogenase (short-subunit alcohol dehydrogenase family)
MRGGPKKLIRAALPLAAVGLSLGAAVALRRRRQNLEGKVVLITGGSRGLGFALAKEFTTHGCRVAICGRDQARLDNARRLLTNGHGAVYTAQCDVSDREQVTRMIQAVRTEVGEIDILVNNAGVIRVAPLENSTIDDFEQAMGVMFWGAVYPTLAVLPEMRKRRSGHIAAITSIGGKISVPHLLAYSCAKFAAVGFFEGLRADVAGYGVRVTTIAPGLMRTGSYRSATFSGNARYEAGWFGLSANLPLLTISAESAARKVVRAIQRGDAERILTPQARFLATLQGISPGFTANLLSAVNRLLPSPSEDQRTVSGASVEDQLPAWWKAATVLGRRAANRLNQHTFP